MFVLFLPRRFTYYVGFNTEIQGYCVVLKTYQKCGYMLQTFQEEVLGNVGKCSFQNKMFLERFLVRLCFAQSTLLKFPEPLDQMLILVLKMESCGLLKL